jgi:hypothetical protein
VPHGTTGGYKNWGCHCMACTIANTISSREYYNASKEGVATVPVEA